MQKRKIVKAIATLVVGLGTGQIVKAIIQNNTEPESRTDKITVGLAGVVVGTMAADATTGWIGSRIDEIAEAFDEFKQKPSDN